MRSITISRFMIKGFSGEVQWFLKACFDYRVALFSSRVVAGESEASSNDLTCTVPSEAFQSEKCCDSCIFNLQIRPILPQALHVIDFFPERLSPSRNAANPHKQVRHGNKEEVQSLNNISRNIENLSISRGT